MNSIVSPNNPLEEALNKLDFQGTLVLIHLLTQKALFMHEQAEKTKSKVSKILAPI